MKKEIVLDTLQTELYHSQRRIAECEANSKNGISMTTEHYRGRASALRFAIALVELIDDANGVGSKMDIRKMINELNAEHLKEMDLAEFYGIQGVGNYDLAKMARRSASVLFGAICMLEDYEHLLEKQK